MTIAGWRQGSPRGRAAARSPRARRARRPRRPARSARETIRSTSVSAHDQVVPERGREVRRRSRVAREGQDRVAQHAAVAADELAGEERRAACRLPASAARGEPGACPGTRQARAACSRSGVRSSRGHRVAGVARVRDDRLRPGRDEVRSSSQSRSAERPRSTLRTVTVRSTGRPASRPRITTGKPSGRPNAATRPARSGAPDTCTTVIGPTAWPSSRASWTNKSTCACRKRLVPSWTMRPTMRRSLPAAGGSAHLHRPAAVRDPPGNRPGGPPARGADDLSSPHPAPR